MKSYSEELELQKLEVEELHKQMAEIETKFGGFTNIPLNDHYWEIRARLHKLTAKA